MYNMKIFVFGYKLNLEILILISVLCLILVGHTICGTCNVPKIMEGFKIKFPKNKKKSPSVAATPSVAGVSAGVSAASSVATSSVGASDTDLARQAEEDKAVSDAAFVQEVFKIWGVPPTDNSPQKAREEARLLQIPIDERDAFLKNMIEGKAQQDARNAQDKAREAENDALRAKYMAAQDAFFKEASKIMDWSPDNPDRLRFEGRNEGLPPDKQEEVLIALAKEKSQKEAWKVRVESDYRARLEKLSPAEREATLKKMINEEGNPDRVAILNSLLVSYSKKEGFTGANSSSWSSQNMTLIQGHSLPEGEMLMFANTKFAPEFCPNTYSNSSGCAAMTGAQYNYLITRGGNNVPYSQY